MVQPDAKIRYLKFELDEKEKMIKMMESSGSGAGEDRVAALEKKVNEMEALVKGLTQELLDLKSIAMKMSKQTEERRRQELKRMQPIVQGSQVPAGSCRWRAPAGRQHGCYKQRRPARMPNPGPGRTRDGHDHADRRDDEVEPRRGEKDYIVASAGYGRNKKGISVKPKQSDLIYAVEEDKSDAAKK